MSSRLSVSRGLGVAILLWAVAAWSAPAPVPPFTGYVVDQTGTLDSTTVTTLARKLSDYETAKGSQVAVLIVDSTQPETIEQYSLRVVEQWKLGRKQVDDGVLLLIAKQDRALRIEVGYALEGVLTDADANRIIDEVIVPLFKHGDFAGGITAGVDRIIKVIDREALPPPDRSRYSNEGRFEELVPFLLIFSFIAGGVLRAMFGPVGGATITGGVVGFVTWLFLGLLGASILAGVLAFLFTFFMDQSGRGGGGWSNRGRYTGWDGGWTSGGNPGGGGFSGGGGGRFGGGGASGHW